LASRLYKEKIRIFEHMVVSTSSGQFHETYQLDIHENVGKLFCNSLSNHNTNAISKNDASSSRDVHADRSDDKTNISVPNNESNVRTKMSMTTPEHILMTTLCQDMLKQLSNSISKSARSDKLSSLDDRAVSHIKVFVVLTSSWKPTIVNVKNVVITNRSGN